MNPWGFLVIGLGALLIIMGVTGSYTRVKDAITGHTTGPDIKKFNNPYGQVPDPGVTPLAPGAGQTPIPGI